MKQLLRDRSTETDDLRAQVRTLLHDKESLMDRMTDPQITRRLGVDRSIQAEDAGESNDELRSEV